MFKYFKTKVLLQQIQSITAIALYFYLLLICPIATNADLVRITTVYSLNEINDKSAAPALIKALRDKDSLVSVYAAIALFNFDIETKTATDIMMQALEQVNHSNKSDIMGYIRFLRKIGISFQNYPSRLSKNQLDRAISKLENMSTNLAKSDTEVLPELLSVVREPLEALKQERKNREFLLIKDKLQQNIPNNFK